MVELRARPGCPRTPKMSREKAPAHATDAASTGITSVNAALMTASAAVSVQATDISRADVPLPTTHNQPTPQTTIRPTRRQVMCPLRPVM